MSTFGVGSNLLLSCVSVRAVRGIIAGADYFKLILYSAATKTLQLYQ